jgi:hypothetical protein
MGDVGAYTYEQWKKHVIDPLIPEFKATIPSVSVPRLSPPSPTETLGEFAGEETVPLEITQRGEPGTLLETPEVTFTDEQLVEAIALVTDPLNLAPGVGWGPEIVRAAKAGVPALRLALKKWPQASKFVDDLLRGGKGMRGGGPLPVGAIDPSESARAKMSAYLRESAGLTEEVKAARTLERGERTAAFVAEESRLLKQGLTQREATKAASAQYRGRYTERGLEEAIGFTDDEAAAFGRIVGEEAKPFERVRLYVDQPEVGRLSIFTKMATAQRLTDAEQTLVRRLFGDEVADAAMALGRDVDQLTKALEESYGGGVIPIRRTVPVWKEGPLYEGGLLPHELGQSASEIAAIRRAQEEAYGVGARPISRTVPLAERPPTGMPTPGVRRTEAAVTGVDLEPALAQQAAKDKAKMLKDLERAYPVTPRKLKPTTLEKVLPGAQLGTEYAAKIPKAVVKEAKRPAFATRILDEILEIPRFFTGLYSLLDASVGGRQLRLLATAFFGARRPAGRLPVSLRLPRAWGRSYWESTTLMFRSSKARAAYRQSLADDPTLIRVYHPEGVADEPFGQLWKRTGGRLKPDEIDERVVSNILRKTPGFKQTAEGFELGLEAGHHSALKNELLDLAVTGQKLTMKDVQALADATTALTGRGNLGKNLLADVVTALGWAPRLRVAFWQSLFRLAHPNPRVRSLAARRIAGYLGTGLTMMGVAEVTGAGEVTWDPRNTDFGKIKIKGIRFNVWGPDVVAVRYLAQGIFGMAVSPLTGRYKVDWQDSLMRYARSGANPAVGLFVDWRTGKTFTGERFDILRWQERLPLAFQDIVDAFELKGGGIPGVIAGAAVAPFVMGGIGVGAYDKAEDRLARAYNEQVDLGTFGPDALYYADAKDKEGLVVPANIQKVSELVQLDDEREILSRLENDAVKAGIEEQYNLPALAKRFNEGETTLGAEIMRKFREYRHDKHVSMEGRLWDVDFGPDSPDEKLLDAWMSVNPHDPKYADPVTGRPDYYLVDKDSDAAEAALIKANPRLAAAVGESLAAIDPELGKMEPVLEEALGLRGDLYDKPRWTGITPEKQHEIEKLQFAVGQFRDRLAAAGLDPGPVTVSQYQDAARQASLDPGLAFVAWPLRGGDTEARAQNPEYQKFLFDHQGKLGVFFPELYGSRAMLQFLQPNIQQAVIAAAR